MTTRWMLTFVLGAALWAQGPMGPGAGVAPGAPSVDDVKAYLKLTDAQLQALKLVAQTSLTARKTVLEELKTKQEALKEALDKGSRDAAALGRALLEIDALKRKLEDIANSEHEQALAVLTSAQRTQLKGLEDAAKLLPAVQQAGMLRLLEKPADAQAGGPLGLGGPGGMGRAMGLRGRGPR